MHYYSWYGGTIRYSMKGTLGHVTPNLCVLHPVGSPGRAFRCFHCTKCRRTIFRARVGPVRCGFNKKRARTCYIELVFLHPVGSTGLVMHSGAAGHETSTHYFSGSRGRYGFDKKHTGARYAEIVFLHLVGSAGYPVHSSDSGASKVGTLFFMLMWA
jgi:hypothetical protein